MKSLTCSYLLRDANMKVRTSYSGFLGRVRAYFQQLVPILAEHAWRPGHGGPIIALQIENEYGTFLEHSSETSADTAYLGALKDMLVRDNNKGLDGVYTFMSDSPFTDLQLCTFDDRK